MKPKTPKLRRVALMLELDWGYARHVDLFAGTQQYALECGHWDCIIDERAGHTLAIARGTCPYDGVIARANSALAAQANRWKIPVVNTWYESPSENLPRVLIDVSALGRLAAEHLLGLGLRRFCCLSIKNNRAQARQTTAFHDSLAAAGCTCQCIKTAPGYLRRLPIRQQFQQALGSMIKDWKPPIGCFVTIPDMISRYLANEIRKGGLRIPDDVALVAGFNEPTLCLHPSPSLTNIEVSFQEVGYRAAKLLDALMDGRPAPREPILVPPLRVAARQSTNFLAVDDEQVAAALQYLVANIQNPLNVSNVAEAANTSRRTLEYRFAAVLGRTVAEEIRRLRLDRAKRFMLDTDLSMKAIAREAGFRNEQRLSEAFRRTVGMTPSEYRSSRPTQG